MTAANKPPTQFSGSTEPAPDSRSASGSASGSASAGASRRSGASAEGRGRRQKIAPVLAALAVSAVLTGAALWVVAGRDDSEDQRTVGEAVAGVAPNPAGHGPTATPSPYPGTRLVELAAALGLPESAVPNHALLLDENRAETRVYLEKLLEKSVTEGRITAGDIDPVLRAFDAGLIEVPVGPKADAEVAAEADSALSSASQAAASASAGATGAPGQSGDAGGAGGSTPRSAEPTEN